MFSEGRERVHWEQMGSGPRTWQNRSLWSYHGF